MPQVWTISACTGVSQPKIKITAWKFLEHFPMRILLFLLPQRGSQIVYCLVWCQVSYYLFITLLFNFFLGLLSEFITGTAMAPLTGIVDLYVGFLLMHMRKKHTGLGIINSFCVIFKFDFFLRYHQNWRNFKYHEVLDWQSPYPTKAGDISPNNWPISERPRNS